MATRARQSTVQPTPSRQSNAGTGRAIAGTSNTELPEYEPPEFSLNPAAQRALAQLARTHNGSKLNDRLDSAHTHVTEAATDINDVLFERVQSLQRVKEKRRRAAEDADEEDDGEDGTLNELEEDLAQMSNKVKGMTDRMEQRIRKIVDAKHAVKHMADAVTATADDARTNASTQASTLNTRSQRTRRRQNDEDGEEESDGEELPDFDPTDPAAGTAPVNPPLDVFNKRLEEMKTRYQSFNHTTRYAEDNDYRTFKRAVHDAQYRDDEVPLPHYTEWFNDDGTVAALGVTNADGDDDSDDDIAVSRATISTKCSLSLREFEHPITSTKCPHSFEKVHILEFIGNSAQRMPPVNGRPGEKAVQCPVGGCTQMLSKSDLKVDPIVVRKIKRLQKAREMEMEEDEEDDDRPTNGTQHRAHQIIDDNDDDEEDATNIDGMDVDDPPVNPKQEPRSSRPGPSEPPRPSQAVDLLDDDDEEEDEEESMYD
ncbi:hypothetical protein M409DRAFT_18536 [Zasmidium cellare ATCC 36951]|uniref:SP-RING-type domain-containing protein n=1 Tax=Zasmidium cellare ATCC 36951 TaxID=1080233 RepID=A0A6A6D011_ZASCE|nr:uncharacterized protein M409DRAFT_18536 [Zasmidium cellare ATCC 36951]KAF2171419.1 hypothetical protein M409DRAFT_18536 [Zasmidium cellare ATCC 36951]